MTPKKDIDQMTRWRAGLQTIAGDMRLTASHMRYSPGADPLFRAANDVDAAVLRLDAAILAAASEPNPDLAGFGKPARSKQPKVVT